MCRSHAYCAQGQGPQYFGAFCPVCSPLWDQARNYELDMPAARRAFEDLKYWIFGFARNSRNRERGVDYFADPSEKEEFWHLIKVFRRAPSAPPRERRSSPTSSHRVRISFSLFIIFKFAHAEVLTKFIRVKQLC